MDADCYPPRRKLINTLVIAHCDMMRYVVQRDTDVTDTSEIVVSGDVVDKNTGKMEVGRGCGTDPFFGFSYEV